MLSGCTENSTGGADTAMSFRAPRPPLCHWGRLAGLVPQGHTELQRDHNSHKMDGGNAIHPPSYLPPLLPPKKGGVRVTQQIQGCKPLALHPLPTQPLAPHVRTSHLKKWRPSRATFAFPEWKSRPKHRHLNAHGEMEPVTAIGKSQILCQRASSPLPQGTGTHCMVMPVSQASR